MSDIRKNEYIDTQILALRSKYHEIQSENQPVGNEIQIGTDRDNGAAITFSILPQTGEEEQRQVSEQMAVIRNDMKKIWKQNVFYDIGEVVAENTPVAWMDFKHTVLMEIFTVSFLCFRRRHGQYWEKTWRRRRPTAVSEHNHVSAQGGFHGGRIGLH